jgi:hypothetical protein
VVVIINRLTPPNPIPSFVGAVFGGAFELVLTDVNLITFEPGIVGQE